MQIPYFLAHLGNIDLISYRCVYVLITAFSYDRISKHDHAGHQGSTYTFWAQAFSLQAPKMSNALRCPRLTATLFHAVFNPGSVRVDQVVPETLLLSCMKEAYSRGIYGDFCCACMPFALAFCLLRKITCLRLT